PLLLTQVTAPVRWVETVQKMALNGVDTVIELGPGKVLAGLVRRIDKGLRTYSVEDPASLAVVLREVFQ
ncbi:MAG TPA: malonyl CoA-acyl carrier protein transacylase, partial [Myxococcales bacterium]|nr:malonyl CoA-acyl carrier protein transacylase [Myxococcales bacterium]